MSDSGKTRFDWIKFAIALMLMCSVLGFSATAQTEQEKPLEAEAVAALIEELTDGLPDLIEDEDQVTAITEKWDERQNLAGKTRTQILNLLFADVKSVIEEKETQDNIWTSWTSEEKSDEEASVETPQKPATPPPVKMPEKPVAETSNPECPISLGKSFGVVKSFDQAKGYGYITPELGAPGAGQDVFVHIRSIHGGIKFLLKDMKVTFELCTSPGPKPNPRAIKVQGHTRYEN